MQYEERFAPIPSSGSDAPPLYTTGSELEGEGLVDALVEASSTLPRAGSNSWPRRGFSDGQLLQPLPRTGYA